MTITSLSTAELVALATADALAELSRRAAKRADAGKKPRNNVLRAIASLKGETFVAPAAPAKAAAKPEKTVADFVADADRHGGSTKWIENQARFASEATKAKIAEAVAFISARGIPAAKPAKTKAQALDHAAALQAGKISLAQFRKLIG